MDEKEVNGFPPDPPYADVLARELGELATSRPDESDPVPVQVAWLLRKANILDEIARVDLARREQATKAAQEARDAATWLQQKDDGR
ncbi:hypothetical protein LWC34_28465 [Kibdelosporangium philippinense]|uniref:DUF2742 domain-containing protein n=1 Tax=Kibdelosporangium philippinense TaxID=211113 RepID=A0ABS8ZJC1_9PSEU|nr:hypothetical protein [Kibdelosporangium philippinense]MCE7006731.1 hypothetical protein [Kibdelosporangium philippinense]